MQPAQGDETPGLIGGRYRRLFRIGKGTYGQVYRGEDTKTGNIVALKKIIFHVLGYLLVESR